MPTALVDLTKIRVIVERYPILRKVLSPALAVKNVALRYTKKDRVHILDQMRIFLVGDVLVSVAEFDGIFYISPQSDLFSRLMIDGTYEGALTKLTTDSLCPGKDVIDIGANVGFYTVSMAKQLSTRRVLAIEPSGVTADRLRRNVELNGVAASVILFQGAAGDRTGSLFLNTVHGKEEYSSLGNLVHPSVIGEVSSTEKVSVKTIDELVSEHMLEPGFIKMDVEGAEHLVLAGARATLSIHKPIILSELSDPLLRSNGSSSAEVISFLRSAGYVVKDAHHPDIEPGSFEFCDILCRPKS